MIRLLPIACLSFAIVVGAGAYLAWQRYWRPVMPEVVIDVRHGGAPRTPSLMVIYGERGNDPFEEGPLGDRRISGCVTKTTAASPRRRVTS